MFSGRCRLALMLVLVPVVAFGQRATTGVVTGRIVDTSGGSSRSSTPSIRPSTLGFTPDDVLSQRATGRHRARLSSFARLRGGITGSVFYSYNQGNREQCHDRRLADIRSANFGIPSNFQAARVGQLTMRMTF